MSRCYNSATGKLYAVKKVSPTFLREHEQVISREVEALSTAAAHRLPRVVQLVAEFRSAAEETCLVKE